MVYVPDEDSADSVAKVVYTSKDRKPRKIFNALDWLARLVTHIPGRYEQTVSDYILELVCDEADSRIPELESWY
jgi:hypothetical protein